jgi:hypothetical protein
MATLRRRTSAVDVAPLSKQDEVVTSTEKVTSEETFSDKTSLLYTMLPTLVRKRLRRIPSIRRSMGSYGQAYSVGASSNSSSSRRSSGELLDELTSPPPEYRSRVSLSEPVSEAEDLDDEASTSGASWYRGKRRVARFSPADNGSGIRWKFSNQGVCVGIASLDTWRSRWTNCLEQASASLTSLPKNRRRQPKVPTLAAPHLPANSTSTVSHTYSAAFPKTSRPKKKSASGPASPTQSTSFRPAKAKPKT